MTDSLTSKQFTDEYIDSLIRELETRGWRPDSRGDPECCDEACAAGADIIRSLQQRVKAAEHNYKWLNDEVLKDVQADNERLRGMKELPANLLDTMEQALREVAHAQQVGSSWYTRGEGGLYQQVAMWVRKGFEAVKAARAAEPPTPPHLREPPHCSTCECGMQSETKDESNG